MLYSYIYISCYLFHPQISGFPANFPFNQSYNFEDIQRNATSMSVFVSTS